MAQASSELKNFQKEERRRRNKGTRSPDRNPDSKLLSSVLVHANFSLSSEQEKDKSVEISGLTDTYFCTSPEIMVSTLGSMVVDNLKYPNDEKRDLMQQFSVYFAALGWKTEGYMTASVGTSLPMPDDLISDENAVGMISPAIKLTLQHIAQFTATVRRHKLYLSKSTTFKKVFNYHTSNCISHQRIYNTASLG